MAMLNGIKDVYTVYPDIPKFSFMWHTEYSHETYDAVQVADTDIRKFLEKMKNRKHLENTLLMVVSDHGARFRNMRHTTQGKLEERMPFVALRFPEWFRNKYPKAMENLRDNVKRLTTPFDIHETLKEIIDFTSSQGGENTLGKRGMSLFKSVPATRSCHDAG